MNQTKYFTFILVCLLGSCLNIEMKGINFVSVPYTQASYSHMDAKKSMELVKNTGANWISVPIAYFQESKHDCSITNLESPMATRDRINATPSNKEITDVVTMAKNLDMKVMLMPVVEINRPGFVDSRLIGEHYSPHEFRTWFKYYTELIVDLAKLAEQIGAEMICIGHNLNVLSHQEIYWNELIDKVRAVYKGKLTYSASSKNEFKKSGFWGKLDYIGMIADFDYKNHHELTEQELTIAMSEFLRSAVYMSKVWKKQVFVSRAFSHSAKDISSNNRVSKLTHQSQATFYQTLLEAVKTHAEIDGIFWGDWVADYKFGGEKDGSLSPQMKPAEQVLRKYYGGELDDKSRQIENASEHKLYCKDCHAANEIDL